MWNIYQLLANVLSAISCFGNGFVIVRSAVIDDHILLEVIRSLFASWSLSAVSRTKDHSSFNIVSIVKKERNKTLA